MTHALSFDNRLFRATLSPDGRTLAVSCGQTSDEFAPVVQIWDAESGRLLGPLGKGYAPGWNAAGRLVIQDESRMRLIGFPDRKEVARWPTAPHKSDPTSAHLASEGHRVLYGRNHFLPKSIRWLVHKLLGGTFGVDKMRSELVIEDACTGTGLGLIPLGGNLKTPIAVAADGTALAAREADGLRVWDIPPRTPRRLDCRLDDWRSRMHHFVDRLAATAKTANEGHDVEN